MRAWREGLKKECFAFLSSLFASERASSAFISLSLSDGFFAVRPSVPVWSPRRRDLSLARSLAHSLTRPLGVLTLQNANTAAWMTAAAATSAAATFVRRRRWHKRIFFFNPVNTNFLHRAQRCRSLLWALRGRM